MATRMQQRRGTAAQWTAADPILAAGEIGFETDTNQFKIGDGVNAWDDLSYFKNLEDLGGTLDDYIPLTQRAANNGVATLDSTGSIPMSQLGNIIAGAPAALNTLNEIAVALDNDGTFASTIITSIAAKLSRSGGAMGGTLNMSGNPLTNVPDPSANSDAATKGYVDSVISGNVSSHSTDTTDVHGIANTALLATTANVATAKSEAIASAESSIATAATNASTALALVETAAATNLTNHQNDTTSIHGISNTADLVYDADLTVHANTTTSVHGIADTAALATKTYADDAVSTHNLDTTNVHGIADTSLLALKSEVAAVTKTSLGLGSVDNTADTAKPVSTAQSQAIATAKAEAIADATSQVNALLTGAPAALNTLDELAAALGDDANFAASVTTNLGLKVDSLTPISQKSASYTLSSLTERDDLIEMGSGSAMTLTIPADATLNFPIGTSLDVLQTSTGQVTIAGASGVTVNSTPGLKLRTQWSSVTLFKRAANTWVAFGDLTA
jgi:hypothetical protein